LVMGWACWQQGHTYMGTSSIYERARATVASNRKW